MLVAHGSRRSESNKEVVALADKLSLLCCEQFPIVHYGFLEIAETLIPDGVSACVDDGATDITVVPYFLNSGRHVVEDIPNIVNDCRELYPHIKISIAPHIGAAQAIVELVITSATMPSQ
ncbi:MAG: CbiX/SirB N-terminal domain-containing protein [Oceanicoccus sp.]